jgi:glyoxylase-like metal-dependent hydrolase (beta-lactamase superfamily II)
VRTTRFHRVAAARDIELIRAGNPGPFTLEGTNTWLVGRGGCWVVDPGPDLVDHVAAILVAADARGGVAGIVLTHDHRDHAEAVPALLSALGTGVPVAAARAPAATTRVGHGDVVGPFEVIATPGHAPDHLAYIHGDVLFSGDAVLGRGSVFVAPDPGALRGYLAALEHLLTLDLARIHPGHGPVVEDPAAKLAEYRDHRLERERRLVAALDGGLRTVDELLDEVWSDASAALRPAAAVTLAAHLDKLAEEARLPEGVERPCRSL